jgi:hypothetical protein
VNSVVTFNPSQVLLKATAYEEISVGATPTPLDATKAARCYRAFIKLDGGGSCRYRIDGGTPSATVGIPFYDGEQVELSQADAQAFLAFRMDVTNPIMRVTYLASVFV